MLQPRQRRLASRQSGEANRCSSDRVHSWASGLAPIASATRRPCSAADLVGQEVARAACTVQIHSTKGEIEEALRPLAKITGETLKALKARTYNALRAAGALVKNISEKCGEHAPREHSTTNPPTRAPAPHQASKDPEALHA